MYFLNLNYNSRKTFWTLEQVQRKFPYSELFKCAVEACPPNLQLEVINLHCNDIQKDKYQEKNLIEIINVFQLMNIHNENYMLMN